MQFSIFDFQCKGPEAGCKGETTGDAGDQIKADTLTENSAFL